MGGLGLDMQRAHALHADGEVQVQHEMERTQKEREREGGRGVNAAVLPGIALGNACHSLQAGRYVMSIGPCKLG